MLEQTHTSLELSKWLKEKGFTYHDTIGVYNWMVATDQYYPTLKSRSIFHSSMCDRLLPAYDILNDLCVTHAKELFGEDMYCTREYISEVFDFMARGEKEDAEQCIMENSIL